jgi:hypothetical protein
VNGTKNMTYWTQLISLEELDTLITTEREREKERERKKYNAFTTHCTVP